MDMVTGLNQTKIFNKDIKSINQLHETIKICKKLTI